MKDDFAAFILTHGRANNVATYDTLKKHGYTGKIYLLVDDTDKQIEEYKERYGDQVIVFEKQKAIDMTNCCDNFGVGKPLDSACNKTITFVRNYAFVIAKELGLKYFLQLDDDYTNFWFTIDNDRNYLTAHKKIQDLDRTFEMVVEFLVESGVQTVCMSQSGDFIGGPNSTIAKAGRAGKWSRKAMNSFFVCVDRPFKFLGRMNEDVNTYTSMGNTGTKFLTIPRLRLKQGASQANEGGISEMYLDFGTYVKSFYTVMVAPSSVSVGKMGVINMRLHHHVKWKYTVPQIVSEDLKKHL
jgi:hypothetical protein